MEKIVYKTARDFYNRNHWVVYKGSKFIEGGFFSKDAAEDCAFEYNQNGDPKWIT